MKNSKLTSVKILQDLYNDFKIENINSGMTLQKLTNRSIHLYLNDNNFRGYVDSNDALIISGSNL
jgi:hypothetical protein|tara:strand:- start:403 stop:597 length:195 start_codon:yes stop_codon:yes gene_type:complete